MILATLHFVSQQPVSGSPSFVTSWVELASLVSLATLVTLLATGYHHVECQHQGCHRLGRFAHEHRKLCHRHHPVEAKRAASQGTPPG